MCGCVDVQQLLPLLVLQYLVAQVSLERVDPGSGLEANLHLCLLSRVDRDGIVGDDLDELFLEFLKLAVHIKGDLYLLLGVVDERHCSGCLCADVGHTEVDVLILRLLEL